MRRFSIQVPKGILWWYFCCWCNQTLILVLRLDSLSQLLLLMQLQSMPSLFLFLDEEAKRIEDKGNKENPRGKRGLFMQIQKQQDSWQRPRKKYNVFQLHLKECTEGNQEHAGNEKGAKMLGVNQKHKKRRRVRKSEKDAMHLYREGNGMRTRKKRTFIWETK